MPHDFAAFAASVLLEYRPPIRRRSTRQKLEQVLREFSLICPTTSDITSTAISDWIVAHPARSAIASFSLLRSFASACRLAKEAGLIDRNPFAARPPARWWSEGDLDPPERKRHLTTDEARRILDQADREALGGDWQTVRVATLVRLLLYTGLRASEALALRWEDIDLPARCIHVRENPRRALKTRASRRSVAIPGPLEPFLAAWEARRASEWVFPASRRLTPWLCGPRGSKAIDAVRALGQRAGISGVTLLALRHTYATHAEALGFGELALQRLMGHRQRRTQLAYRHADPEVLRLGAEFRL